MPTHGTMQRGVHPAAKLTAAEVQQIRRLKGRQTARYLAFLYDIAPSAITEIWRGESWRWLPIENRHQQLDEAPPAERTEDASPEQRSPATHRHR